MNTEAAELAAGALTDSLAGIDMNEHENYVRELVGAYRGHVREALAAGAQLEADRAELRSKSDLIPPAGAQRLEREAHAEATDRAKSAMDKARASVENLRRAALLDAQPKPDKEREGLGRDELNMIVGSGSPAELMTRVHRVASTGSRDAVAALMSPFGRSLLYARGLAGSDLDGALASARKVVVESAETNASRHTAGEIRAARLYAATGGMDGAVAAASFALGHVGISHA